MSSSLRYRIGLAIFASIFFISGSLHWISPAPFLKIMPPFLPWPRQLVQISGAAELLGAIGLLQPRFRRAAGFGLAALLIAVFPANIYMAVGHVPFNGIAGTEWFRWLRLPLQLPLIWCALYYTRPRLQASSGDRANSSATPQ